MILAQLNVSLSAASYKTQLTRSGFQSLLQAIEAEDKEGRIEIHIYLTAKIEYVSWNHRTFIHEMGILHIRPPSDKKLTGSEDKMNNILVNDVGAETDAITSLRSPTHFGRPNVRLTILLDLSPLTRRNLLLSHLVLSRVDRGT